MDRWPLFVDHDDYLRYVALLAETVERFGWILLSFCLMPNHIHLLVEVREPNLRWGMHRLQGMYARWFNDRHGRKGRLFEHRYDARPIEDEIYFLTLVNYIEQNPVKPGLCESPAEWPWSSRGMTAGGTCPQWLADDELTRRRQAISGL